jgi:hypothetical protein
MNRNLDTALLKAKAVLEERRVPSSNILDTMH